MAKIDHTLSKILHNQGENNLLIQEFAGDALSFHTLDGSKFTVAYTVDAEAKKLNQ